ncbi:hypothetical protein V1264_013782 [Littorina saxatilis]|uniref:Uncharacterized protein n=1 Tax=Littorina saxatilis TaxID=31220 RepID=A0AAN9BR37_9CAEN
MTSKFIFAALLVIACILCNVAAHGSSSSGCSRAKIVPIPWPVDSGSSNSDDSGALVNALLAALVANPVPVVEEIPLGGAK